ncbi:MAG TPA: nucleotidyltransferase family protein [Gemmataceae bacterium]|jgi:molybdenum cofactor cytidylyltransferase
MRFAVLPAAGKSTRMGRPKLALPLGERTILEHVVATLRQAEVEHILVIIGPHMRELAVLAENAGAHHCQLTEETADMRATVEHGLRWLEELFQPRPDDSWLLVPADHPTLTAAVVRALEQTWQSHPEYSIFVPTYQGRRGHPLLLTWKHVPSIREHLAGQGLNTYIRQRIGETLEVSVADPDVLVDLDTPEDYEWLRQRWPP